jgi:PAS domain S-box-containing protein
MNEPQADATQLHLDSHMAILSLTADLYKIFAQDESENANLEAINAIGRTFNAAQAAIFYINSQKHFKVCISGTDYPIALPEKRWKECVMPNNVETTVSMLGDWSIPGIGMTLPAWISVCLYTVRKEGGYVFIGKEKGGWSDTEVAALASLKDAIAPVVRIRHERAIEALAREEARKQLAQNEARLRNLFEGSRDMIYTADVAGVITSINLAGIRLLGYSAKQDLLEKPFSNIAANPGDRMAMMQKLTHDGYVDDYEIILKKKDGSPIFCLETTHVIKDGSGAIAELQGSVKDISSRIENERKLWKMNLELAEANLKLQKTQAVMIQHEKLASIGQLAAGVAHEINNPLGFLISNNGMLEKYLSKLYDSYIDFISNKESMITNPERQEKIARLFSDSKEILTESKEGFDRIVKIVGSLKNFSRIDGSAKLDSFDLNAGIESTIVVAWNEIKYVSELHKNLGEIPHVIANGNELNQVILNILVNAAQATGNPPRKGKGLIEISTRLEGENVLLSIHDDGPGIPKDALNKVFDPFFTTKEPGKGTGLGLSISYDIIVNKHGGAIWVESDQGPGTTFYISLPVAGAKVTQGT